MDYKKLYEEVKKENEKLKKESEIIEKQRERARDYYKKKCKDFEIYGIK